MFVERRGADWRRRGTMRRSALIVPGKTCWRSAEATRFAHIVDGADYLRHVKAAMLNARHRIVVIGWDLDYRTAFERGEATLPGPNYLGPFLTGSCGGVAN